MGSHALLSASSSKRWIECPPSARLCERYEDQGSDYAAEGTEAHALCEYLLKTALGMEASDPRPTFSHYTEEMLECAESYVAFALEIIAEIRKTCKDPQILIEQKLSFSEYVPGGYGTGDLVICGDGTFVSYGFDADGKASQPAKSAQIFDADKDPLFSNPVRVGGKLVYVSFGGTFYAVDDSGDTPKLAGTTSIATSADPEASRASRAPRRSNSSATACPLGQPAGGVRMAAAESVHIETAHIRELYHRYPAG